MSFSLLLDSFGIKFADMNSAKLSGREWSFKFVLNLLFNHKPEDLSLDCSHLVFTFDSGEDLSEESCHPEAMAMWDFSVFLWILN